MKSKVLVNVIAGDKAIDSMMHSFDMFESWKHYGECIGIEWTTDFDEGQDISALDYEGLLARMREVFENNGHNVIALWVAQFPQKHFVDWSVKAFSDGKKWSLLRKYLEVFDIKEPCIEIASHQSKALDDHIGLIESVRYKCPILGYEVIRKILPSASWEPNCEWTGAHGKGFSTTECCDCGEVHKLKCSK